ncbi:hypothetical protein BBR47_35450 [Brevibacillus brevis NBRC 100599]|uniref:Uncharacterized protein n=1 Tax=Brevibacillus brevis (strain 47 / JCM 6285 / NBRC 100599) TaxID=358681 RepID=C0ZFG3_BREBN|nr:hypothetical protein [Brevibacillus brevis]BAH44522.1 hypothetical protein BBR47_35450 [Brevibacillus brevis NBRC 100599]
MNRFLSTSIMIILVVVMITGMIYAISEDVYTLSKWSDLTKSLSQIYVTIALGYAAFVAAIAATLKHAGKFAQHKKDLFGMITAFIYFIVMSLWLYMGSFSYVLSWVNIIPFLASIWTFIFLSSHFLRVVSEMLNITD